MVAQLPLTWGGLSDVANDHLWQVATLPNASVAPPTIWLAARLPGSGKRASRTLRGSGRGGDNGTDPGSASGGASASNRPVRELVGPNASLGSRILRRPASAAPKRRAVTRSRSAMWQRTYQKLSNWLQNHDGVFPRLGARSSEEKSLAKFVTIFF